MVLAQQHLPAEKHDPDSYSEPGRCRFDIFNGIPR